MKPNIDIHYCKFCDVEFTVSLPARVNGDYFLVCPVCSKFHYRHFTQGVAIHCDINKTEDTPAEVIGMYLRALSGRRNFMYR